MPGHLTEITELGTALGTLRATLGDALRSPPPELANVPATTWDRLIGLHRAGLHAQTFTNAFSNGHALLVADDGLRNRPPRLVEWNGPHRVPGDDVVPADLRVDHVYLVSCKYLSKITQNCGPARLFDRLLVGEQRSSADWFAEVAPTEYQAFYASVRAAVGGPLPETPGHLDNASRSHLKTSLASRSLPSSVVPAWQALCQQVAIESAARWASQLASDRTRQLRMLWRLLRIGDATYFVLGTSKGRNLRLRVTSAWDWMQHYELRHLRIEPRQAGQPEVSWVARVRTRSSQEELDVLGHVEIRWSHGRLQGAPEAKVYLDTPFDRTPGYEPLR